MAVVIVIHSTTCDSGRHGRFETTFFKFPGSEIILQNGFSKSNSLIQTEFKFMPNREEKQTSLQNKKYDNTKNPFLHI